MSNTNEIRDPNLLFSKEQRFAHALVEMERELAAIPTRLSDDALLTTREAGVQLSVSPRTLEKWRALGTGPKVTHLPTGGVRYSGVSIRRFIESCTEIREGGTT